MAGTPTVYVICDNNCKFEGMTKEQILTAIMQAVESGEIKDVDAGFVTTIKTINGAPLKFFVGEQAAYDALTDDEKNNLFAIITNDTTKEGLLEAFEELQNSLETLQKKADATAEDLESLNEDLESGDFAVAKAKKADVANGLAGDKKIYDVLINFVTPAPLFHDGQYLYFRHICAVGDVPNISNMTQAKNFIFTHCAKNIEYPITGGKEYLAFVSLSHDGKEICITYREGGDGGTEMLAYCTLDELGFRETDVVADIKVYG